jgi:hypothetical protein
VGDGDEFVVCSSAPAEGYSVCDKCFDDDEIKAFIKSRLESKGCDFCGRRGRTRLIAAPLDDVVDFMIPAIEREYEMAGDALGWDSSEGGYLGPHWDSYDLLVDQIGLELPSDDGRLLGILVECFGDQVWCERHPYALRRNEQLVGSWEDFCEFIKYRRRYFFLQETKDDSEREYLAPSDLLKFIGDTIDEHQLIRIVPKSSLVYRARQLKSGQALHSPYDFGPPPVERALRSNRMSPAGIVMFYGSDDAHTAVAEIDDDPRLGIAVGTFRTTRDTNILDLTRLPRRMGFFEEQSDSSSVDRYALIFLHRFVKSLAARVEAGDREYIDYVPTQVLTEWFRTAFHREGPSLDGIRYQSSQRAGGKSLVLFADRHDVVLTSREIKVLAANESTEEWFLRSRHENAWLKLVRRRVIRQPAQSAQVSRAASEMEFQAHPGPPAVP